MNHRRTIAIPSFLLIAACGSYAAAEKLDEISLEKYSRLRETERYQLKIAEKYYDEKKWKVAAAEYEKYLVLYERSEAAAYSQLKWSLCQRNLKQLNTAIKEGFQSVVDYWPDSDEAIAASYYIGRTYKDMGEVKKAKTALKKVVSDHPKHLASVRAAVDLIDVANLEKDVPAKVALWETLTFETKRNRETQRICQQASVDLASHRFGEAAFEEGVKALETTYADAQLVGQVLAHTSRAVSGMTDESGVSERGAKLADLGIGWLLERMPAATADEADETLARGLWYAVADLHSAAKRDPKVIETYGTLEKKLGADDAMLVRLGAWYKSRGRYDDARKAFARIKDPIEAMNQVAISYRDEKQYDLAVTAFQKNVAADPENAFKWQEAIAATYHHHAHDYPKAIAAYESLMKADVERTQHWLWQIARAYHESGKHEQAIGHYRQCTNFPQNYWEMANCHRAMKQWDEAVVLYNQIIGGSEGWAPQALLQVGYTFEQAGRKEQAIAAFQQVCKRFPTDGHASRAHAHLQNEYKINVTLGGAKDD